MERKKNQHSKDDRRVRVNCRATVHHYYWVPLVVFTLPPIAADVNIWADGGAAPGCINWSQWAFHHYGIPYTKSYTFHQLLQADITYVPGGWHPERYWPTNWRETLELSLITGTIKGYLGICAGAFTFAIGGARYHTTWPPEDYWRNGITVAAGMLGPNIWTHYRCTVLGHRSGWILYWNGPLFAPEYGTVLTGPGHGQYTLPYSWFLVRPDGTVWAWIADMRVNVRGIPGYGAALGIIYHWDGHQLHERARVALFGPHPEFYTGTWWMLKRAIDFLEGDYTPTAFHTLERVITTYLEQSERQSKETEGRESTLIPVIPVVPIPRRR